MASWSPRVSIIMPAYNCAQFIGAAVESVLHQTYPHSELIVVNDGSTDGTREVLQPFMDRLRYMDRDHRGSAAARNAGLSVANGEIVAFMDADDLLPPRAIDQRVARMAQSPSAAVVCTGWRIVDVEGRAIVDVKPWRDGARLDLVSLLLHKQVLNGTITIRRDCIDQVGGFDEALGHSQDIDLIFRIALAGYRLVWLREISCFYRRRSDSASQQGPIQAQMMDRVLDKVFRSRELPESARQREAEVRYYTHLWFAWHLAQLGFPSEMRDRLKQALQSATDPDPEIAFQWMRIFSRWSRQFAYRLLTPAECYEAFCAVFPKSEGSAQTPPDALDFWWRIWRTYLASEWTVAAKRLSVLKPSQREEFARWVQALIFNSQEDVDLEVIARIWNDARTNRIVAGVDRHEIATLYLSAFSGELLARRWKRALRALLAAVGAGLHPRGLLAWLRFARSAMPRASRLVGNLRQG